MYDLKKYYRGAATRVAAFESASSNARARAAIMHHRTLFLLPPRPQPVPHLQSNDTHAVYTRVASYMYSTPWYIQLHSALRRLVTQQLHPHYEYCQAYSYSHIDR